MTAAFYSLNREKEDLLKATRIIGGVYSNRVANNQLNEVTPFVAVDYVDQRAMSLIVNKLLANEAFVFNEEILKLLQEKELHIVHKAVVMAIRKFMKWF